MSSAIASKLETIQAVLQCAQAYLIAGKVEQAEQLCRHVAAIQTIAADRGYAEAYCSIALFHIDQGEYEQAVATARRAIELNPRLADAYLNLAEAEMLRHRYDLALGAIDALNAVAPEHMAGQLTRSKLLELLDCWDDTLWENCSVL
jgi:tetratricopeptide (TPR) repeat protein